MRARELRALCYCALAGCANDHGELPPRAAAARSARGVLVEAGAIAELPSGQLAIRSAVTRALLPRADARQIELAFTYRGPTEASAPLASGELRRQIGVKLRAHDTCNVVYAMWYVEPGAGLHVSVKSNPGLATHAECRDHGYQGVEPTFAVRELAPIRVGERRRLGATLEQDRLTVYVDGALAWQGTLPPSALAFDGPLGLRTDNAKFDLELGSK